MKSPAFKDKNPPKAEAEEKKPADIPVGERKLPVPDGRKELESVRE